MLQWAVVGGKEQKSKRAIKSKRAKEYKESGRVRNNHPRRRVTCHHSSTYLPRKSRRRSGTNEVPGIRPSQ